MSEAPETSEPSREQLDALTTPTLIEKNQGRPQFDLVSTPQATARTIFDLVMRNHSESR